jgi:HEAT repeats
VQSTSTSSGNLHSWSISRQGYLNSIVLGYALAVFAYVRGEDRPQWARHLRTDAAVTLRAGLGYLLRTGDSLFRPDATEGPRPRPTPDDVTERLGDRSPTVRLGALWDMRAIDPSPIELVPAVEACLRDRDTDVQCEAAKALGRFGAAAVRAIPVLLQAVDRGRPENRAAALYALGAIRPDPAEILPTLTYALRDDSYEVASAAAAAIGRYGPAAVSAEPALLTAIEAAALTDYHRLIQLVAALRAVSADPRARIREHFAGSDGEIRRLALGVLKDQGG